MKVGWMILESTWEYSTCLSCHLWDNMWQGWVTLIYFQIHLLVSITSLTIDIKHLILCINILHLLYFKLSTHLYVLIGEVKCAHIIRKCHEGIMRTYLLCSKLRDRILKLFLYFTKLQLHICQWKYLILKEIKSQGRFIWDRALDILDGVI